MMRALTLVLLIASAAAAPRLKWSAVGARARGVRTQTAAFLAAGRAGA